MKDYVLIIVILIGLVLAFLLGRHFTPPDVVVAYQTDTLTIIDTIAVPSEPIIIEKAVPKIKYLKDTIIQTQPFIATLDTITRNDTIKASYQFPENYFDISIRKQPDTIRTKTIMVTNTKTETKVEKREWWLDVLTHLGAFGLGFLLGK